MEFIGQPIQSLEIIIQVGQKKHPHPEEDDEEPKGSKRHLSETNNDVSNDQAAASEPSADLSDASNTLSAFIAHSYTHKHIAHTSRHDLDNLLSELRALLLAHITQIEDKTNFSSQPPPKPNFLPHTSPFQNPRRSYITWIYNTSAIHTSCLYSFALFKCLVDSAKGGGDYFVGTMQKYLAQVLVRHLAAI